MLAMNAGTQIARFRGCGGGHDYERIAVHTGGYRVLHDRGAVSVGNEAPVWTSPTKPKSRMTTRSRHRLITGLLVNLTLHYSKLFSAGWTSILIRLTRR